MNASKRVMFFLQKNGASPENKFSRIERCKLARLVADGLINRTPVSWTPETGYALYTITEQGRVSMGFPTEQDATEDRVALYDHVRAHGRSL